MTASRPAIRHRRRERLATGSLVVGPGLLQAGAQQLDVRGWSRTMDAVADAAGANGELLHHDYAFHTDWEDEPWWSVDLLADSTDPHAVAIVNRVSEAWRFRTFRIDSSHDGDTWTTRFEQDDPVDVSSDPETPFVVQFANSFPARYIRIVLLAAGVLHLRRVQVFGTASQETRADMEATDEMACAAAE